MAKTILTCTVNGKVEQLAIDVRASLAEVLRKDLGLTSVKQGCEVGECGACTVLIDGETFDSCIYLAMWAEGKEILTVESLMDKEGNISPIQQAFIDEAAVQCGFCTPGFIMSSLPILRSDKKFTRNEIKKLVSGNLCRCTGYENIINAIEKVKNNK